MLKESSAELLLPHPTPAAIRCRETNAFPQVTYDNDDSRYSRRSIYYDHASAESEGSNGNNEYKSGWRIVMRSYDPCWPQQFEDIQSNLQRIFETATPPAEPKLIEHIGSTAVPGICAKPNIDVLVTFSDPAALALGVDALLWEIPTSYPPFVRYTRIPNGGGIQGRESFKLYLPTESPYHVSTPEQSVYLIDESDKNPAGRIQIRCYRSLRDTLRNPKNSDLLQEYSNTKLRLAQEVFDDSITYSARKDGIVRMILLRAGWTDEEVNEKERLSARKWIDEEEPPY